MRFTSQSQLYTSQAVDRRIEKFNYERVMTTASGVENCPKIN